jgi:hypothetical protein
MEEIIYKAMNKLEQEYNFDPYSGRKLYAYLYDLGYEKIKLDLRGHHLFYGKIKDKDLFNWSRKMKVGSIILEEVFESYPGGRSGFFVEFEKFFLNPRRFTYTPLILCKGMKPLSI